MTRDVADLPRPGDVLAGKYCVQRVLGVGGMGVVVAATHMHLRQIVALKLMRAHGAQPAAAVERFLREARAAVQLKSSHVGRILDVGTLETGAPYIVMEYLEGVDLDHHLASQGPLPAGAIADLLMQACDALAEAHALGIVHRDLKPANLFLARSGNTITVKVLDFGISKARRDIEPSVTGTDTILGSPAYMSPEQMRSSKSVDQRSDIWSLGIILYQAVTGKLPFDADSFADLCLRVMLDPVPSLATVEEVPPGFEDVVRRCLEKEPALRYASIAELSAALARFSSPASQLLSAQIGSGPVRVSALASADTDVALRDTTAETEPRAPVVVDLPRRWPRRVAIALPVVLLAGLAGTLVLALQPDRAATPPAAPPAVVFVPRPVIAPPVAAPDAGPVAQTRAPPPPPRASRQPAKVVKAPPPAPTPAKPEAAKFDPLAEP